MAQITQFFEVIISSPKKTKSLTTDKNTPSQNPKNITSVDVTDQILEGLKFTDEDGLIKTLTFSIVEGYTYLDILSIGMVVNFRGGDLVQNELLFSGTILTLTPEFSDSGEVLLEVVAQAGEGAGLARIAKDVLYPSKNHNKSWGKQNMTYSQLIVNLAKDAEFEVSNEDIVVSRDRPVTFKTPIRQKNKTDWDFIQSMAKDIKCTCWVTRKNDKDYLNLKDNSLLMEKLGGITLIYLARTQRSEFIEARQNNPKQIQMISVTLNLDTRKGKITSGTDPVTGKTVVTAEGEGGEKWILDEEKVRALPESQRRELMQLFLDGKISWEATEAGEVSARPYFKLVVEDESSRVGTSSNIEVEESGTEVNADGVTTKDGVKQMTGSDRNYKTVIDKDKVRSLSSEDRASLMGRIARKEMTDADREYYTIVETTPKPEKPTDADVKSPVVSDASNTKKDKRDAGFKIEATVYGRLDLKTKKSYVLEGLGKYSAKYYLYRVVHQWGGYGWQTVLTFVK